MRSQHAEPIYAASAALGEGPLWDAASGTLYFVDIKSSAVHAYQPASGKTQRYQFEDYMCWLLPRRDGDGFMAGTRRGLARLWLDQDKGQQLLLEPVGATPVLPAGVRLNDAKVHPDGSLWFGSMHDEQPELRKGELYRLGPDLDVSMQAEHLHICNGPAFSRDGSIMFHNDSLAGITYQHAVSKGRAGPARLWKAFTPQEGSPDGMCMDSEGGLWIAFWGASCVRRFLPDGSCDRLVQVSASQVSSVAFG